MIQTAIALSELGVKACLIEGEPSILSSYAGTLESYKLGRTRSFLRDTIGVMRTAMKTRCDSVYAFSDYFPESVVPSFLVALITRKSLFVNVTNTAYRAADGRRFLGLLRSRFQSGPEIGSVLAFAIFHASRRLACRFGTCFVANRYMGSYAKSRLHARRTIVVGAGVEKFWYERTGAETSFDCVYSGRFDPSKRVPILIRAWQIVVNKKPDARLLLIGESGTELPLVKRLVGDLGLTSNVVFAGYVNDRRVLANMVMSAKVFVFPSVMEGFGLVIAEAMAAGLPCVLSDVEPLREVFGESAILVTPDEPSAFAGAILGLLLDEVKRLEYSAQSVALARSFTWDSVGKKVFAGLSEPSV
ncbi:MAG: glycosyltransferase [Thaumarchaeota archaeon]|nr:glycosyltransferase [Nitrososphaerota archaeon]